MAITIVATAGSASANSFATAAEMTTHMEGRLNDSAYTGASADEVNRALVEATRELSSRQWMGRRVDDTQALSWPREWVIDPDSSNYDYFESTEVPQRVKDATCELAFQFLKAGTADVAAYDSTLNVKRKKTGPLETEYFSARERPSGLARYPSVTRYLWGLLEASGPSVRRVRS